MIRGGGVLVLVAGGIIRVALVVLAVAPEVLAVVVQDGVDGMVVVAWGAVSVVTIGDLTVMKVVAVQAVVVGSCPLMQVCRVPVGNG